MTQDKVSDLIERLLTHRKQILASRAGFKEVTPLSDDLLAAVEALSQAYERGQVEQWQPIETAPKDGTEILIAHSEGGWRTMARWLDHGDGFYEVDNDPTDSWSWGPMMPTHWQPLPSPPAIRSLPIDGKDAT